MKKMLFALSAFLTITSCQKEYVEGDITGEWITKRYLNLFQNKQYHKFVFHSDGTFEQYVKGADRDDEWNPFIQPSYLSIYSVQGDTTLHYYRDTMTNSWLYSYKMEWISGKKLEINDEVYKRK